jgi:flavin-dependent dehydrogenase
VLIVGGGPAGLAAAIALRMRGADVLVADALKLPIDKACGEGLMPDARRDLAALGVDCDLGDGAAFRGIQFLNWADCEPVSVSADFAGGTGIGIRRTVLHSRLVERAWEVGVRLRWNTHVGLGRGVLLDHEACQYGYLLGADGQASRVRRWAGLDRCSLISKRFGFRRHYRVSPVPDYVEVHWCEPGQVYITPVGRDEVCVAAVTRQSVTRMQQILDAIPGLRERLPAKDAFTGERGALTTTRRLRRVVKGNVALIGDASGSVDAVTGEGLAIGFRQADLLSRSLEQGSLDLYAAEHEMTLRMARRMARALLMLDKHAVLRKVVMNTLAESPELFRGLLYVHVGDERLFQFLLRGGVASIKRLTTIGVSASDIERASP